MARPREFEIEAALDRAMNLFWRQGYEATSTKELLQHMGIGRQSLYDTFGDKHSLFLKALERYCRVNGGNLLGKLESADASLDAICQHFHFIVDYYASPGSMRSCLMINSIAELAAHDPAVAKQAQAHFARSEAAFANAIANAIKKGEIRPLKNPQAIARHLSNTASGLGIHAKGGATRQVLSDTVEIALSVLS